VINGEKVLLIVVRDITERKRSEALLRESEERFSGAFEYASIGMALVAPNGAFVRVNWALCWLLGYSETELLQKTFSDITFPADLQDGVERLDELLAGEIDSFQAEKRYFHNQGHVVWALLSVSLVQDNQGKPQYFITQIQDITERKRAEESLQAERKKAEKYLEIAGVMMLALDREGTVTRSCQSRAGRNYTMSSKDSSQVMFDNWSIMKIPS
jgi:PAS domain S-box-containing protein